MPFIVAVHLCVRLLLFNILQRIFCFSSVRWMSLLLVFDILLRFGSFLLLFSTVPQLKTPVFLFHYVLYIQSKTYRPIRTEFIFALLRSVHLYLYLTNEKNDCHAWCLFLLLWLLTSLQAHQFGEFIRASCIGCVFTRLSTPPFNIVTFVFVDRVGKNVSTINLRVICPCSGWQARVGQNIN